MRSTNKVDLGFGIACILVAAVLFIVFLSGRSDYLNDIQSKFNKAQKIYTSLETQTLLEKNLKNALVAQNNTLKNTTLNLYRVSIYFGMLFFIVMGIFFINMYFIQNKFLSIVLEKLEKV